MDSKIQSHIRYYESMIDSSSNNISFQMWEIGFLFCTIILAIVVTLPETNPLRVFVVTCPFFIQEVLKTRDFKKTFQSKFPNIPVPGGCKDKCCVSVDTTQTRDLRTQKLNSLNLGWRPKRRSDAEPGTNCSI